MIPHTVICEGSEPLASSAGPIVGGLTLMTALLAWFWHRRHPAGGAWVVFVVLAVICGGLFVTVLLTGPTPPPGCAGSASGGSPALALVLLVGVAAVLTTAYVLLWRAARAHTGDHHDEASHGA